MKTPFFHYALGTRGKLLERYPTAGRAGTGQPLWPDHHNSPLWLLLRDGRLKPPAWCLAVFPQCFDAICCMLTKAYNITTHKPASQSVEEFLRYRYSCLPLHCYPSPSVSNSPRASLPLSSLSPLASTAEYQSLIKIIKENSKQQPVKIWSSFFYFF